MFICAGTGDGFVKEDEDEDEKLVGIHCSVLISYMYPSLQP